MLRFAHISDLHFAHPNWNPLQIFSKRWLGNVNFTLNRRHAFDYVERLPALFELFKKEQITHVFLSGDLSITSHPKEFEKASVFVEGLKRAGLIPFVIPGNHDHYTRYAYRKKLFYKFFPSQFDLESKWNLQEHKVSVVRLDSHLWLVTLDTAIATSLFSSQGHFNEQIESNLQKILRIIPSNEQIILLNHFPFFQNDRMKNRLLGGEALRKVLEQYPNILLYLHGHTHRRIVADLRANQLPILSDPGSTLQNTGGCHLIQIEDAAVIIRVFDWEEKWQCKTQYEFVR